MGVVGHLDAGVVGDPFAEGPLLAGGPVERAVQQPGVGVRVRQPGKVDRPPPSVGMDGGPHGTLALVQDPGVATDRNDVGCPLADLRLRGQIRGDEVLAEVLVVTVAGEPPAEFLIDSQDVRQLEADTAGDPSARLTDPDETATAGDEAADRGGQSRIGPRAATGEGGVRSTRVDQDADVARHPVEDVVEAQEGHLEGQP